MKLPAFASIPVIVLIAIGCTSAPGASVIPSATTPAATSTTAAPESPRATPATPPSGALGYGDFADVGWLGSYCWQGTCADGEGYPDPESLPEITAPEGTLIFSLEGAEFVNWVAMYGADGDSLQPLAEGGAPFDPDVATPSPDDLLNFAEFDSPPAGNWVVTVHVFMPGGDASYAWHVLVE